MHHREPAPSREVDDLFSVREEDGARQREDGVSAPRACGSECRLNIVGTMYVQILKLHAERLGGAFRLS